ncbi:MAG: tetratricopeptide repeat protein [Vicingaceae bacterium]
MDNSFGNFAEEPSIKAVVLKYEQMLSDKKALFFDVEEFEDLVAYYTDKNESSKALAVVEFGLKQHPQSASLLLSCAQLYVSIHKPQEALRFLNMAESFEPFNIDLFHTKASIFSQLRKSDRAIEQFKKALEFADKEEREDIYLQLAFEYENANKHFLAIETLKEVLAFNPENEIALYELGFCYDITELKEAGKDYFTEFVDKNPYSHIGWYNLGISFAKLDLFEKAIECYDFAIAIKEDYTSAYFNKAHCYSKMDQYEDALACYSETLQLDTEDALSYFYIGECYEKLEEYEKAISFYKKSVELDEFIADGWFGIASALYELDRYQEGLSYIIKAIELDEFNFEYFYLKGDLEAKLDLSQQALESYQKAHEIDENDDELLIDLAFKADELGQTEAAMEYFCEGVRSQADNAKLLYNFVAFLLKKGDVINAMFYLDIALKNHYEEREELFLRYPEAEHDPQVVELIEYYKK